MQQTYSLQVRSQHQTNMFQGITETLSILIAFLSKNHFRFNLSQQQIKVL
ncbi:hypothetical protein [Calothrix sp. PCC 6303]|nr:hypothetical protein [Calothrix sp. PCC 6303]